ncbi:RNA helicase [Lachancea thermotolerans CBS 6340]|uniref:RNA helicase n=1 Tax=Lachancea thermotolerans (strain ATCC 56472 / CBS 6340 / NRRL Y-8284) TaxID=559295 RepID=C5DCP1_LACTC|nr:KLTH0B04664p [Lachancea thermotolerans CBS 6340]CAR21552.1 KLTH0B04664p [Lachancea thermotolerans CBS 6340]
MSKGKKFRKIGKTSFQPPKNVVFSDKRSSADGSSDHEDGLTKSASKHDLAREAASLLKVRATLPVYKHKDSIMSHINKNQVTILIGETGSGKSTQIPQFLMENFPEKTDKRIAVTQPRRVAAINLASRVAQEYGCRLGERVGYSVRFDNKSNARTKLKYLTDGMLLREIMLDKNLSDYSCVIIDEAHERTILTDLILGFLKELINSSRQDLKVVVMSATLQAEKFSEFFGRAPILFVEGRKFPVQRSYLKAQCDDVVDAIIRCCVQLNQSEQMGDILCFMPGQEEIDKAVAILSKVGEHLGASVPRLVALPLYAALPPAEQAKVFAPVKGFKRKVVFSTNLAETSVTISGVKFVVDSGLRKVKVWRHQLGLATLLTVPISKASASQRTGRAGRESAGKCFRLYREQDYQKLPNQTEPEIARSEVTSPILMLKKVGVKDIVNWSWLENPGKQAILMALQELFQLGALDDSGKITNKGQKMALLPLAPHLSSVLLKAHEDGCLLPVIDIVSCLSVENLLINPSPEQRDEVNEKRFSIATRGSKYGDLVMLKEFYDAYMSLKSAAEKDDWCKELCVSKRGFKNVVKIRAQLLSYMERLFKEKLSDNEDESDSFDIKAIVKCFLAGFAKNTAIGMPDRSFRTSTTGETISVHPSSMLFMDRSCPAILYTEYVFTTKGYARNVSRLELSWLQEVAGISTVKVSAR